MTRLKRNALGDYGEGGDPQVMPLQEESTRRRKARERAPQRGRGMTKLEGCYCAAVVCPWGRRYDALACRCRHNAALRVKPPQAPAVKRSRGRREPAPVSTQVEITA